MNADELRTYMVERAPSVALRQFDGGLECHGCAHSASGAPKPGQPSGERPCCSCVRNPERPWAGHAARDAEIVVDDQGEARCFDPFLSTAYNGVPLPLHPSDRYRTLDGADFDNWLDDHPEYVGAIVVGSDGVPRVARNGGSIDPV